MGELLARSPRVPVVSATGSTRMGRAVAVDVAQRFGRSILELGGNNAMVVMPSADLELAAAPSPLLPWARRASAAPRCAALIVHRDVAAPLLARLERSTPACAWATRWRTACSSARWWIARL